MARRFTVAVLVAAAVSAAVPGVPADAESRIGINGGKPSTWPFLAGALADQGLTQEAWQEFGARVGENWLPSTKDDSVGLDYPAQLGPISGPDALSGDASTNIGQANLDLAIKKYYVKGQPLAVAGLSEGTLVIDQELVYLSTLDASVAPDPKDLTFYVFGDMNRGLGYMYFSGMTVPFFGKTFGPLPDSQYNTTVVNEQWDGWANTPDRPWNLLADVNALMGAIYTYDGSNDHSHSSLDSMNDAVLVSQTTSSKGGVTSTYIVPRKQLPITKPLLQLGVPQKIVDQIDNLLRPLIALGYSNMTPNFGPRIDHGKLVWTPPKPLLNKVPLDASDVVHSTTPEVTATVAPKALAASTSDTASAKVAAVKDDAKDDSKADTKDADDSSSGGKHRLRTAKAHEKADAAESTDATDSTADSIDAAADGSDKGDVGKKHRAKAHDKADTSDGSTDKATSSGKAKSEKGTKTAKHAEKGGAGD
jgi:hypothetical protein